MGVHRAEGKFFQKGGWPRVFCDVLYSFLLKKALKGLELLQPSFHQEGKGKRIADT